MLWGVCVFFACLYRLTGKQEYLDFAKNVENDLDSESAGEYMHYATEAENNTGAPSPGGKASTPSWALRRCTA